MVHPSNRQNKSGKPKKDFPPKKLILENGLTPPNRLNMHIFINYTRKERAGQIA
jgi:hypothetical protein